MAAEKKRLNLEIVNKRYQERVNAENEKRNTEQFSYLEIAALFSDFDLNEIRSLTKKIFNSDLNEPELLKYSSRLRYSQKYVLDEFKRKEMILLLDRKGQLKNLFDQVRGKDVFCNLFDACLAGKVIDLSKLEIQGLNTLQSIVEWLSVTSFKDKLTLISHIRSRINQERLLHYFKIQTKYFSGRNQELKSLGDYVHNPPKHKDPLLIYGVGGIGKSTLVAQFILQCWEREGQDRMPFVYLDFDKIIAKSNDNPLFEPLLLAKEAFRQLSIQFPAQNATDADPLSEIYKTIEVFLEAPDSLTKGSAIRGITSTYERDKLYESIERNYLWDTSLQQKYKQKQVLVVMDSFEVFQTSASNTEFYELLKFLGELEEMVPNLRILLVGRTDYFSADFMYQPLEIGPFDLEASIGYLKVKGMGGKHQIQIAKKAGGSPLALNLLANLVLKKEQELIEKDQLKDTEFDWVKFYDKIDNQHINEQLVLRNIEHISENVRSLGIPGIVVRKINPDIIQNVLAAPCDLGVPTIEEARNLFEELKKEFFLLEEIDNELCFRRDLRASILDLIKKQYGALVIKIHENALAYYRGKSAPSDRAEHLYHRLMRGDGVKVIDELYTTDLKPYLERSLWEFAEAERIHLYSKMGKRMGNKDLANLSLKEWELYLISRIQEAKGLESLNETAQLLEKREKRTDNSPLLAWEAELYTKLGQFKKIEAIYSSQQYSLWNRPLKVLLAYIKKLELENNFSQAHKELGSYMKQIPHFDYAQDLIAWAICVLRVVKRYTEEDVDHFIYVMNQKVSMLPVAPNISNTDLDVNWDIHLTELFPPAYASILVINKEVSKRNPFQIKKLGQTLKRFTDSFLNATEFQKLIDAIKRRFDIGTRTEATARKEMSLFLENRFDLLLDSVSFPSSINITVHEFACFLEQFYKGKYSRISEALFPVIYQKKNITKSIVNSYIENKSIDSNIYIQTNVIRNLISSAKIDEALVALLELTGSSKNESYRNDVILLSSRFHLLEREEMRGTISYQEVVIERAKIVSSAIQILSSIET